jgi:hypothetical protein
MAANMEYQFHNMTDGIENLGQSFPAGGVIAKHGDAAASSIAALKHQVKYWGGLALLVALGVVGIPFLIYFAIGAVAVILG